MSSDAMTSGIPESAGGDEANGGGGLPRPALARLPDVARRAGVSTATVDRVLNKRPGVRPVTVQRVLKAAAELNYILESEIAPPVAPLRLVFLLPAGTNRFLGLLGRLIASGAPDLAERQIHAKVEYIKSFSPDLLARALLQHGKSADGIAFMALEHPAVREAVNALADKGVPTVTLISDLGAAKRVACIGLDNRSAGRTAGSLIARFIGARPGKVAMIAGSLSYRAHEEREMGFLHLFEEMYPQIEVVGLREGQDDEARNYRQTRQFLAKHPDLAGIYNIGGGAAGVGKALREMRRTDVVFVGHGLTPDTRALLLDGTMDAVITQNPESAIQSCVGIFSNLRAGRDPMMGIAPPRIDIVLRENLP
ncbi:LacI family transcriptional regulator [Azorhizobium oxalatiphilum]|uniref:LacI family transcriptional regulator n=1 Tax=Azorhizobium oxalatiphilum TaxID=980631 RepID=A0A917BQK0_9HYPH|nr:LacI family DNA-binding transcriptional regulator [Azorhizobium oxalatiphilum]GGF55029.1 LacI family transcriptional regulator [Azorhizobium oxalatiphilum]